MKEIKVEWCENFIKAQFTKHHHFHGPEAGIEMEYFWKKAEASGLWVRGSCGSPMSIALVNLTDVEAITTRVGAKEVWCYDILKLKQ